MSFDRIRSRLEHIVLYADRIAGYLDGYDFGRYRADVRTVDAVERCIERIAEAVVQIGAEPAAALGLPIPFNDVRSLGNRLRHDYSRIDPHVIYDTARRDIPALRDAAQRALDS
ncbi:HepT-like ribonuclease domain-containing protein [Sphingomonas sp. CV7422]|uniref:HepT-like ribonuclease domain-containing protein n=1 Tax=Sphingomonas sp. CV7422 TaxID=3018036 RepID=UPI0022FF0B45|nr:HepT-like ribonuclease domain-containing protein [Sphingomonas sp. CV7422]